MEFPKFYYNSRLLAAIYLIPVLLWFSVSSFLVYAVLRRGLISLPWFGWVFLLLLGASLLIFGTFIYALGRRVFLSLPRLKLSDSGVTDYTQRIGEILWTDIEKACLRSTGHSTFICLELRNSEKYLVKVPVLSRWLNKPNRQLGFTPITLNLSGVKADCQDLLSTINKLAA